VNLAALTDDELRRERARAHDAIDAAFWRFTMCRRAPPPPVAVPWAYGLRNACDAEARRRRP